MTFSTETLTRVWRNRWLFAAGATVISVFLALLLANLRPLEVFEFKTYDARFGLRGELAAEADDIVVVGIDDASFAGLGKWPFSRVYFAKAIKNLYEAGARLIVLDVEFTEPNTEAPRQDLVLAAAVKRAGNVILAGKWVVEHAANDIVYGYPLPPMEVLQKTGVRWGLVNVDEDPDGFVRRYLLFQPHNQRVLLPLSVEAFRWLAGTQNGNGPDVVLERDGYFVVAGRRVPKHDDNSMLINFRGPAGTFPRFSFVDVIDDSSLTLLGDEDTDVFEMHKELRTFENKIVFIGATAEELQDNKLAPFFGYRGRQRKLPGVELHANALSTLLRGDFIRREPYALSWLSLLLLAALTSVGVQWLKPFRGMFAVLALWVLFVIWAVYAFINLRLWVPITPPLTALAFAYVGNVVHQLLTEQRERIRIKKTWEHYMSENVIDAMLKSGRMPEFGGERRELTVLFSDIRGFTTFSERHSSHEVVQQLNEYLTAMVDVIFKYGGTLDKFVGDEIMAVYGAPHYFRDHAEKACRTALEMVARLRALQHNWSQRQKDIFQIGIGINTGKVIAGNLGSSQLFDYTVIGDDVNLGARLEGANKQYGTTIIISEATYRAVRKKAIVRELDLVRVKGKQHPVRIYELRGMGRLPAIEQELIIDVYTRGLTYYKEKRFYEALKEFRRILRYFPTDGPTRVYIQRCLNFMEMPPPENWDGVYEFTTK